MLMPKRTKWRKQRRGRMKGMARRGASVQFGEYGLQATGTRLADQPSDRSRPPDDGSLHPPSWQNLDPGLPG